MATLTALKNDARKALEAARALAGDGGNVAAFNAAWAEYETKLGAYQSAQKVEESSRLFDDDRPAVSDLRNPGDADDIPNVDRRVANAAPEGYREIGPGRIVPYASKDTEGFIRNSPLAVQMPSIMARYGPDLLAQAELERKAFAIYMRKGDRARDFEDANLRRALNALQEGTDSEGGYLVPIDQRVEVIHDPGNAGGQLRRISRVLQTSRDGGTIPTGTTITWGTIAEEATPAVSDPAFNQVQFTIRKSGANMLLSEELLADSAINLPAFIGRIVDEESGEYEDQQGIEGDGATEPLGLRTTGPAANGGAISDVTDLFTLAAPTLTEVVSAWFELPAQFRAGATWYTTSSFMARIAAISATGGQQWIIPDASGRPMLNILGSPVVMFDGTGWDNANTIAANEELGAFGNFQNYIFMDRLGVIVRRDDSLGFASDQVYFKARKRYDSFYSLANAFRILKAAAS
ncbi:MAG: phage major capsid protein [Burkholderiaceae bacterium]